MAIFKMTSDRDLETQTHARSFITRNVKRYVLTNGLTVLTKEMHDRPVVASMVWYRVGSRNEELAQTGKSHFLEHMLFKGTDRYKKGEIDLITVRNGGANNAFTWLDFTAYYFTFASDRWQTALEIEANRMRHTTFADEEFESEKRVVEEELRIGLDGPWEALENEVWATAFRQHPYHWPTVGWLEDLEAASSADMKAYYDKWYHPRNATLVLVGDFDSEEVIEKVTRLFGSIPSGPEISPLKISEPPQKGEKRVVVKKETPVERMLIGYHVPAVGSADNYALQVLETLLSTGKASRLYRRLVEGDQSVTFAKAHYHDHIDPPLFYIKAELKPGSELKTVERAIYEEIDRLKKDAVPETELEKAKRQIEASLVLGNQEPLEQALLLGQYETIAFDTAIPEDSRGYKYLDTLLDRIRAVEATEVARVARKYFTEENRTVGYLIDSREESDSSLEISGSLSEASTPDSAALGVRFRTGHDQPPQIRTEQESSDPSLAGDGAGNDIGSPGVSAGYSTSNDKRTAQSQLDKEFFQVERVELPNGLVLLISENHSMPSVSIRAAVRTGSRFETDDKAGLASLAGELIAEGTAGRSAEQIAETVEAVGGRLASFGDYQESGVRAAFLSQDLWLGLDVTADLLMNATFPEEKVRQHIERRAAQIKSRLDSPRALASDVFNEIVFRGHPQHRPSIGYEETVKNLKREDMVDFYNHYYVPDRTLLVIVGDCDAAEVKEKAEHLFGNWKRAEGTACVEPPRPARQTAAVEKFVHAPKEQVNILIGHVGIERTNKDYYSLLVLDTILGSSPGFTSRIPRILRDQQGLAYSTYSNITASAAVDPGRFVAYIGTSPENLDKAISGLRSEIERIVREPVDSEELETAKAYLTGHFVFDFQTNAQIARFLVDSEIYGLGYDYPEKYPQWIRAVTIEDVARVAREYLDPDAMTTVVAGPVDERGKVIGKL
ncbi:MAG: insulinase family protein [Blastocatellia bacterium]|nr:insulinase family protein [Blastocatellia bacterium]